MAALNKKLAAALAVPIIFLALLCAYKAFKVMAGKKIIVPITGFDPRDILSGHYLTYRLKLDAGDACQGTDWDRDNISLCLALDGGGTVIGSVPMYHDDDENLCDALLSGKCSGGSFVAGIERFYIPENESAALDRAVRSGEGSLVVSVDRKGKAAVKELLINGKPWREAVRHLNSRE